jgi:hypothetical protein
MRVSGGYAGIDGAAIWGRIGMLFWEKAGAIRIPSNILL